MTKIEKTAARNARKALLASATGIGFDIANGFARAVVLIVAIKNDAKAMTTAQENFVSGYVANRLGTLYADRLGNADRATLLKEADKVIGKASPDSKKPDDEKRLPEEHKAVRAAATSWATAKRQAGIAPTKAGGRKARPGSNAPETPAETGAATTNDAPKFTLAAPKLSNDNEADAYLASAIAALLATVDVNADSVSKPWSDFINATYQRAVKAKLIPSAE